MERVVARIGRPHGLRGEVSVEVRTDVPEQRFVPGAVFATDPADRGPLTLVSARDQGGLLVLGFSEAGDRSAAEALRDTLLVVDATASDEHDRGRHRLQDCQQAVEYGDPLDFEPAFLSSPQPPALTAAAKRSTVCRMASA